MKLFVALLLLGAATATVAQNDYLDFTNKEGQAAVTLINEVLALNPGLTAKIVDSAGMNTLTIPNLDTHVWDHLGVHITVTEATVEGLDTVGIAKPLAAVGPQSVQAGADIHGMTTTIKIHAKELGGLLQQDGQVTATVKGTAQMQLNALVNQTYVFTHIKDLMSMPLPDAIKPALIHVNVSNSFIQVEGVKDVHIQGFDGKIGHAITNWVTNLFQGLIDKIMTKMASGPAQEIMNEYIKRLIGHN